MSIPSSGGVREQCMLFSLEAENCRWKGFQMVVCLFEVVSW